MKSRLALVMVLSLGLVMSLGGVGLGISGLSSDGSAGVAQYGGGGAGGGATTTTPTDGGVLGEEDQGVAGEADAAEPSDGGVAGAAEEARQVSVRDDDDEDLPFTGYLAIPLILAGVALLVAGGLMRRRLGDAA